MKLNFPSGMPVWEQLIRSSGRKKVGRKHTKQLGPGKKRTPTPDGRIARLWKEYGRQFGLYMNGVRDTLPKRPDAKGE